MSEVPSNIYIPKYGMRKDQMLKDFPKRKGAEMSEPEPKKRHLKENANPQQLPVCLRKLPSFTSGHAGEELKKLVFRGEIDYILTAHGAEEAVQHLLEKRPSAVGLDLEWRVIFKAGAAPRRTATLQLCSSPDKAYVIHVFYSGWPPSLKQLLMDPAIMKVGVNITGDFFRVASEGVCRFSDIKGVGELTRMARTKSIPNRFSRIDYSLQGLCACVLGKYLPKTPHIRTGNWERKPLDVEQLLYAATDAYASLRVYEELMAFPDVENPSKSSAASKHPQEGETPELLQLSSASGSPDVISALPKHLCTKLSASQREVHRLFHQVNCSMAEIAIRQGIKLTTVQNYLAEAIQAGYAYDWAKFNISGDVEAKIHMVHEKSSPMRLKTYKENLPEEIDYWQIKVCLAHFKRKKQALEEVLEPLSEENSSHQTNRCSFSYSEKALNKEAAASAPETVPNSELCPPFHSKPESPEHQSDMEYYAGVFSTRKTYLEHSVVVDSNCNRNNVEVVLHRNNISSNQKQLQYQQVKKGKEHSTLPQKDNASRYAKYSPLKSFLEVDDLETLQQELGPLTQLS